MTANFHALRMRSLLLRAEAAVIDAEAALINPDEPELDKRTASSTYHLEFAAMFRRVAAMHARLAQGKSAFDDPPDIGDLLADRPSHETKPPEAA